MVSLTLAYAIAVVLGTSSCSGLCLQPFFLNTDVCVDIKRNYILFFSKGMIGCNFVSYFTA